MTTTVEENKKHVETWKKRIGKEDCESFETYEKHVLSHRGVGGHK